MRGEREERGNSRQLTRPSFFPFLARQLEQALGPLCGLAWGEAPG